MACKRKYELFRNSDTHRCSGDSKIFETFPLLRYCPVCNIVQIKHIAARIGWITLQPKASMAYLVKYSKPLQLSEDLPEPTKPMIG